MDNTQFHNNKFLFYNSYNAFKDDLEDNPNHPSLIDPKSIVFIKDQQIIWTHGVEFTANSESFANLIE